MQQVNAESDAEKKVFHLCVICCGRLLVCFKVEMILSSCGNLNEILYA